MPNKKRKSRARRKPATPQPPWGGDHGTGTSAANAGTVLEEVTNDQGENPNRMKRRRRKSAIENINLSMRQEQAAKAIEQAWCRVQELSSGMPLKEQVDSSPKPDAVIAAQVEAQGNWVWVTSPLLRSEIDLVRWVCCENQSINKASRMIGEKRAIERFQNAMDRVANHMKY